jgi:hypothetical protein
MTEHAEMIRTLVQSVSTEQARWKPDPASWSILEVVNHLYDEEREDFRVRLGLILHQSGQDWPPIDPPGWVVQRGYNQRDLGLSLSGFLDERRASLAWLRGLGSPDWQLAALAPWGKFITAGDMLSAWVAHDLLHLRQLVELHWAYTVQVLQPYSTAYAGDW